MTRNDEDVPEDPDLTRFWLPATAIDVFCESLALPRPGHPLDVSPTVPDRDERSRIAGQMWAEADDVGLTHRGKLEPEVRGALTAISRPQCAVTAFVSMEDGSVLRLAACQADNDRVLAVQPDDWVCFALLRPDTSLPSALASGLPEAPAGTGRPFAVPLPKPETADAFTGGALQSAVPTAERRRAAELDVLRQPRTRAGQLGAYVIDGDDRRHHAPSLTFFDTANGRHLLVPGTRNGAPWMRCTPTTAATTANELERSLRKLKVAFVR